VNALIGAGLFAAGWAVCRWSVRNLTSQIADAEMQTRVAQRQKAYWKAQARKAFENPIGYTLERNRKLNGIHQELIGDPTR
jgi:hypothetical protein